jgi:hypothetical protein
MRNVLLALTLAAAFGCSDRNIEIARQLMQEDPAGGPPTIVTVADCPPYAGMGMERLCVVDSDGRSHSVAGAAASGKMLVTTAAPPYGVYFLYKPSWRPLAADVSAEGADASVRVYAAPYNVEGWPCCAEHDSSGNYDEANRIAARASVTQEGGVLVTISEALPSGTQVAVVLVYSALYRGRIAPADGSPCNLPDELCNPDYWEHTGWVERFYVGEAPALTTADGSAAKGAGK